MLRWPGGLLGQGLWVSKQRNFHHCKSTPNRVLHTSNKDATAMTLWDADHTLITSYFFKIDLQYPLEMFGFHLMSGIP
jgi:hypothetical protein